MMIPRRAARPASGRLLLLLLLAAPRLLAQAGVAPAPRLMRASAPAAGAAHWLTTDVGRRTARFVVRAGLQQAPQPELNFNGTSMGEIEFRVPVGWVVEIDFSNVGQAVHSARVVRDAELAVNVGAAAFAGAESPRADVGVAPGAAHVVRFRPVRAGRYRVSCAVPAHGFAGMWLRLTVDAALTRPDIIMHPEAAGDGAGSHGR
jgi:uncharacterized cupredoxin-like copper-binding protein